MKTDLIRRVPLFATLTDAEFNSIEQIFIVRSYRKNQVIFLEEETGNYMYIVLAGKVKVTKSTLGGRDNILAIHQAGDFFGEMTVLDNAPRSADVITFEECKCLVLSAWDFNARMNVDPEIALKILPVVVKRFRETNERLLALSPS